jgi:class 3 adenylate cyclase
MLFGIISPNLIIFNGALMEKERVKRKLAAIMNADVKDYSRLMRDDEATTVRTLNSYRQVMTTLILQHYGRVVDSPGDNLLADFNSVVDAVQAAVAIQKELKVRNAELPENRKMRFRIGINLGDVIVEDERIYGDGVNIAARLEGLAEPGGICISRTAYDQIEDKLPLGYEYIGEKYVKNIPKPVHAYRVLLEPEETPRRSRTEERPEHRQTLKEPGTIVIETRRRDRRQWTRKRFFRSLRAYCLVVGVLLIINLLKSPERLWVLWLAIPWGVLILLRWWQSIQSSSKDRDRPGEGAETPEQETRPPAGSGRTGTLVIQIEPKGKTRSREKKVNIRIPLQVLGAGMKLGSVLPSHAREKINDALREKGLDVDLFSLNRDDLGETLRSLGDLSIDVDREDRTVKIFYE